MKLIPYGRQSINEEDIQAVVDVLRSDFLTQGPVLPRFEKAISNYCGARFGVAVNSATSALHLACLALGVGVSDVVWTTPITFVATANAVKYCGASVDFVDIDPETYNMSIASLTNKLQISEKLGTLPKVVIPVHLAGQSCDMESIYALSKKYGFKIVEDASHAIGASYKGNAIGGCQFSDITVFSFHPVKIITTGEGGIAVTNSDNLANMMSRLRSHGITRDPHEMTTVPDGPWYYQQTDLGFNYRMTEMQAALGLSQMNRLDDFVSKRRGLAENYNELLKHSDVDIPIQIKDALSSWHLYVVRLNQENKLLNHREVFERLRVNGIGVNLHYIPIYRQPYYADSFNPSEYPEAEKYYSEAISLPIYPDLTESDQLDIVNILFSPIGHQTIF